MKPPNLKFSLEDVIDAFSYGVRLGESEPGCPTSRPASKADVEKAKQEIMSAISEFAARQTAHNDRIDAALTGVEADVVELKRLIEEFQNSPGAITPEDQALLDQLEARTATVASKLEALDALTPPAPPPA